MHLYMRCRQKARMVKELHDSAEPLLTERRKWFSLMYLCGASLSSYSRLGVLHSLGQGGCDCGTTRERGREEKMVCLWHGSHIKGKKSSISPAKCAPGRRKGGREREREQKKDERLWTDNTCAGLQIYSNQAARELCHAYFYSQFKQIAAMFQSLTSSCCSSARGQGCGCCIISISITPG